MRCVPEIPWNPGTSRLESGIRSTVCRVCRVFDDTGGPARVTGGARCSSAARSLHRRSAAP